ncbi:MAG: hypothetical protein WKG07_21110 [Hymenobacter sp.]
MIVILGVINFYLLGNMLLIGIVTVFSLLLSVFLGMRSEPGRPAASRLSVLTYAPAAVTLGRLFSRVYFGQLLAACWLLLGVGSAPPAHAGRVPAPTPAPPPGLQSAPDNWLLHDVAGNRLILYLPGYHAPAHTYYQWVQLLPRQPLPALV